MTQNFKCQVTLMREDEDGYLKMVREEYLIDALNYSHAEQGFHAAFEEMLAGTSFTITKIDKMKVNEVLDKDGEDNFWQVKAVYVSDDDSFKGKKVTDVLLVNAEDIHMALLKAREHYSSYLVDVQLTEAKESKILEIFENTTKYVEIDEKVFE